MTQNERYAHLLETDPECRRLLDDLRFGRLALLVHCPSDEIPDEVDPARVLAWDPGNGHSTIPQARPRARVVRAYAKLQAAGTSRRPTWNLIRLAGRDFDNYGWPPPADYAAVKIGRGLHEYLWGRVEDPHVLVRVGSAACADQRAEVDPEGNTSGLIWLTKAFFTYVFPVSVHRLPALAEWAAACTGLPRYRAAFAVRAVYSWHVAVACLSGDRSHTDFYGKRRGAVRAEVVTILLPSKRHAGRVAVSRPNNYHNRPDWWTMGRSVVTRSLAELKSDPAGLAQMVELAELYCLLR